MADGEAGEVAVSSAYLATGCWTDEKLTRSSFAPTAGTPGARTYRTGDLGRLRADGCLERDGLAQVLGQRVQPAGVEAALAAIPGVQAVAVRILGTGRGDGRIVAHIVSSPELDVATLRTRAAARLPAQMRPSRYLSINELPLGPNGKVDRNALPEPLTVRPDPVPPSADLLEARIADIVAQVLEHPIARDEDFFLAGGDSLAAVDLLVAIERELGRRLPPSLVLRAPTVVKLAAELRSVPGPHASLYPISSTGDGAPMVLVPNHSGHALVYARLARNLEAIRPVWALEASSGAHAADGNVSVAAIARHYVDVLRRSRLTGPLLLGGYCYGGVVAFEMAHQLIRAGTEVARIYLLGISPYDFPGIVPPEAAERWARSRMPLGMLHRAARIAAKGSHQQVADMSPRVSSVTLAASGRRCLRRAGPGVVPAHTGHPGVEPPTTTTVPRRCRAA